MGNERKMANYVIEGGKMFMEAIHFNRENVSENSTLSMAAEIHERNEIIASYNESYGFCKVDFV